MAADDWCWTVNESISGRLDQAIAEALGVTRSQVRRWIDEGRVSVDGAAAKPSERLRAGQTVRVAIPEPRRLSLEPEDIPVQLLHEDEDLLVVNKPQGLTVHPSETSPTGTLVHALLHRVKDLSGIGGALRPGIVHRLDKNTSGALVVTKTDRAHVALSEAFARHEIERAYWALCFGAPRPGRIESRIGRNPADRKRMAADVRGGRRAVTHVKILESYSGTAKAPCASWVEARLETGRTHQVRVHLTSAGGSVMGDPTYGVPTARAARWLALPESVRAAVERLPGQALHARVLGFRHPVTGRELRFEAEPPREFAGLLAALREI